jgi:hypothetical protein
MACCLMDKLTFEWFLQCGEKLAPVVLAATQLRALL